MKKNLHLFIYVLLVLSLSFSGIFTKAYSQEIKRSGSPFLPQDEGALPQIDLLTNDHPSDPITGKIFLSNFKFTPGGNDNFLLITDQNANVIQSRFLGKGNAIQTGGLDFRLQPTGVLSYCSFHDSVFYILDSSLKTIDSVRSSKEYLTDVHELIIHPDGSYYLLSLDEEIVDMSTIVTGGKKAAKVDHYVIEGFDKNKNKIFDWKTRDHFLITDADEFIDLTQSYIDFCHPNGMDFDRDGNILLCSRHMDEITKIDRQSGNIIWRFGGKHNQFTFLNDSLQFSNQHSIRVTPEGNYLLLDNGNHHPVPFTRACEYILDTLNKTATLHWQYRHEPDLFTPTMGSVQRLSNGNTLIGWGSNSDVALTEVNPEGKIALEMKMYGGNISYRVFKFPWKIPEKIEREENAANKKLTLTNYPNPASQVTTIEWVLPERDEVKLNVSDCLGRTVAEYILGWQDKGEHGYTLNTSQYPKGTYFYRLSTRSGTVVRRMVIE